MIQALDAFERVLVRALDTREGPDPAAMALLRTLTQAQETKLVADRVHDLRAALGWAVGFVEEAHATTAEAEGELATSVSRALDDARRILLLAEELAMEAAALGGRGDRGEETELRPLLHFVERHLRRRCGRDLRIEVQALAEVWLLIPRSQILRVLTNLVDNALAAVAEGRGSRIVLSSWRAETEAFIEVADDGPGPPPGLLHRIFDRGVSGGEGSGLGLFVARTLCRESGGDLVHLARPGGGSSFVVSLPIGRRAR